jgi:hypothetical protein
MAGQLYSVQLVATATAVTGSIAFVKGLDVVNTVDNITFGQYAEGGTSTLTSNISDNFVLSKDGTIPGPIYAFKSADTTGRFLVYFNKN